MTWKSNPSGMIATSRTFASSFQRLEGVAIGRDGCLSAPTLSRVSSLLLTDGSSASEGSLSSVQTVAMLRRSGGCSNVVRSGWNRFRGEVSDARCAPSARVNCRKAPRPRPDDLRTVSRVNFLGHLLLELGGFSEVGDQRRQNAKRLVRTDPVDGQVPPEPGAGRKALLSRGPTTYPSGGDGTSPPE